MSQPVAKSQQPVLVQPEKKSIRIGLFVPLYLDSAFDASANFRYPPKTFPKFHLPGLEFYEGALLALDTLAAEKISVQLVVKDTRSGTESLTEQLNSPDCKALDLIVAYCAAHEIKTFAEAGLLRGIPVINVNSPNDGGVIENPFLVLLNSTLRTQCLSLSAYIREKFTRQSVVVFRKKGLLEDRIQTYLNEAGKSLGKNASKFIYVDLPDSFTVNHLIPKLDTLKPTLCLAGSLDENFGRRLALQLASLSKSNYGSTLIGMPTWDAIRDFVKPEYRGIDIVYCTPFFSLRTDSVSQSITHFFNEKIYARPSDMVLRGYEAIWHFSKLYQRYGNKISSHLTSREFEVFRELNIQPQVGARSNSLDYFENKKLYFLTWRDGILHRAL